MVIQDRGNDKEDTIRCCPDCLLRHGLSVDSVIMKLRDLQPHRGVRWSRKRGRKR